MNYRRKTRLLSLGALGLALVTGAILVAGFLLPVEVEAQETQTPGVSETQPAASRRSSSQPSPMAQVYEQLEQLASRPLRRELEEPRKSTPQRPAGLPRPKLSISLVGTAREPGHSMAVFGKPDGSIQWVRPGETIETPSGNVTLEQVTAAGVTVRFAGETVQLELPATPDTGGL
jgi:hypothetical protein